MNAEQTQHTISVVIPLYNKGRHIVETVNRVLAQTHTRWQLIIVDDGSTDDGRWQAEQIKDERIRVLHQSNQGVCAARNRGLSAADTEYVAFLDADDLWYPWHLEELNRLMNLCPGQGIYSVAHKIRRDSICYHPAQPFDRCFQGVVTDPLGAFSVSLSLVHSSTACLNRHQLMAAGGFPDGVKKGEDVYVWLRAALEHGLAYSCRFCAEYNQDAEQRCSTDQNPEIPYYLKWLDQKLEHGGISESAVDGAQALLAAGIFYNAAGFKLIGNHAALANLKKLYSSQQGVLRLKLALLSMTPAWVLSLARRFRHRC